ncbi:hypothetical protein PENFLA_c005G08840 [Penicillium flavigenum]|uniref:Aminoglycoside phosphotransferase domain-containing protein n=1 Tax=Penicillium flavigenum TaxID=254877 RepID=A0A1V6TQE6_9EURO|nr:hypothetical protein PENFLA_c005G08840 [Penicillium flavigenum]
MSAETPQEYSVDEEILYFFRKTSATQSSCDDYAQELVGGSVVPVTVQGVCSYTVYAGPNHEFLGLAWKNFQRVNPSDREAMFQRYESDLRQLFAAPPSCFRPVIQQSIESLLAIFSLLMVLVHKDVGVNDVMVDADDNHLVGVIDWAEAEIGPFGTNLHSRNS